MSKFSSVLVIALVLFVTLSYAAESRRNPVLPKGSEDAVVDTEAVEEENCEGPGQDECLMRRTLADRTDYIYTQSTNP